VVRCLALGREWGNRLNGKKVVMQGGGTHRHTAGRRTTRIKKTKNKKQKTKTKGRLDEYATPPRYLPCGSFALCCLQLCRLNFVP
jgi:hypothetical protein